MDKILLFLLFAFEVNAQTSHCIAHRGNGQGHLENSWSALQSSIRSGAHGVEIDIQHTFDRQPILMHDGSLRRTAKSRKGKKCPLSKKIKHIFLKTIMENCQLKNGEDIPLLEDVLEEFKYRDLYLFVELKDYPSLKTVNILEKHYKENPYFLRIISFKKSIFKYYKFLKKQKDFWSSVKFLKLSLRKRSSKEGEGVNIFMPKRGLEKWMKKNKKYETGVWTVNDRASIRKAKRYFVKFITTDKPRLCLDSIL